jgi:hypothetical protein
MKEDIRMQIELDSTVCLGWTRTHVVVWKIDTLTLILKYAVLFFLPLLPPYFFFILLFASLLFPKNKEKKKECLILYT